MRRQAKLLVALGLIATSAVLILWKTGAEAAPPALGVTDAKLQAEALQGKDVTVRGNVVEGKIVETDGRVVEFVVADAVSQLLVLYNQTPPDNFGAKEVVLKGTMELRDGVPVLRATSIQVGCASKY